MPSVLILVMLAAAQAVALPRAVPYLPQTEALCGGAAAAMVMRYWGASARPEEFAPLIDPAQDGIVTTALVADLRARGWQAFPLRGNAAEDPARHHLSRGRPVIALIEDRPSRYHYVVITAIDAASVSFHDPAIAPAQAMTRAEFERRWRAANFWMLLLLPPGAPADQPATPDEPELASRVAALLRSGDTAEALRVSRDAARRSPDDPVAWDAVGTSLFVSDRDLDALDAWNRAGRPDIDTIQIAGLSRTRFRAAEGLIALRSGERLTPARLARARRRLALLPSAISSRVSYTPLADGRAQVDAAIAERPRLPGASDLIATAATAPFTRDVDLSLTNLVGGGERVTASWRFRGGFERIDAAVEVPAPLPIGAVWKVSGYDARETYAVRGLRSESRWQRAGLQAADWINGRLGWIAAAGFERWPASAGVEERHKIYAGARGLVSLGPHADAHVTAEGWMRGRGATRLSALARVAAPAAGGRVTLLAGTSGVHGVTPYFVMPGAGGGQIRTPMLRAHGLLDDGAISVDGGQIFARRIVYGTIEWSHPIARVGPAGIDAAVFTDAARGWQMLDARLSGSQIDAGAGLRVRLPAGAPTLRFDAARGLRDGRWAFSAGTVVSVERWIF